MSARYHTWLGREPGAWRSTALELKHAADAVAEQWARDRDPRARPNPSRVPPNLGPAYMLLAAFAIENLAKGILIGRDPSRFPLTSGKQGGLKTHDLMDLFSKVGGTWTGQERTLVKRLSTFAEWSGRYPIPLAATGLAPWRGEDDVVLAPDGTPEIIEGSTELPSVVDAWDPAYVTSLFSKLLEMLDDVEARRRAGLPKK